MLLKIIITISVLTQIISYIYVYECSSSSSVSHLRVLRPVCFRPRRRWAGCSRTVPVGFRGSTSDLATAVVDYLDYWCCRGCCCRCRHRCWDCRRFRCYRRRPQGFRECSERPPLLLQPLPPPVDCSPGSSCSAWTATWRPRGAGRARLDREWCSACPSPERPDRFGTEEVSEEQPPLPHADSTRPPHSEEPLEDRPEPDMATLPGTGAHRKAAEKQRNFRLPLAAPVPRPFAASIWFCNRRERENTRLITSLLSSGELRLN